ncbi:MAG TPA: type II toxin-antitoxin system RelE/ParE family toxin [Candidatus Paceibacterota bacterium]
MEIRYSLTLHPAVIAHDLPKLDVFLRQSIRDAVREKLGTNPELYGKPLRYVLKGCRTFRVGDYRVVFQMRGRVIYIIAIVHRRSGYGSIAERL